LTVIIIFSLLSGTILY